jgi:hypothetical protein
MGLKFVVVRSCKRTLSEVCVGNKLETFTGIAKVKVIIDHCEPEVLL